MDHPKILIVDDDFKNRIVLKSILKPLGYQIFEAEDGQIALERVAENRPDVILMDAMMPNMTGFEATQTLKNNPETKIIPIIMVTGLEASEHKINALEAGVDDFLNKPVDRHELKARVRSLLKVKAYSDHMLNYQKELRGAVAERTRQLQDALIKLKGASLETIVCLSRAAEYKDQETASHILRMSHYSRAISRQMGFCESDAENLLLAAPMHDIGKIGIPDRILFKPSKLDSNEWEVMKSHTKIGAGIFRDSRSETIQQGGVIAMTHHEKYDGSGYPKKLKGDAIPLIGRITALADVFDALSSKRPYKEAFPLEKSFAIIKQDSGSHFDPDVVDAFFRIEDEILEIKEKFTGQEISQLLVLMERRNVSVNSSIQAE